MTQLFELQLKGDIRDRLGKLPRDLEEAYKEMYDRICAKPGSVRPFADRAFQWVMCSREPLSPGQLVAVVCQDPTVLGARLPEDDVNIDIVLDACNNLLVVNQELDHYRCRFSHLSVQEYLESHLWTQNEANGLIAKFAFQY